MTLGKGRASASTDADIARLADSLQCHPADLEAIAQVESAGFGWFSDGRIKILFEKHWFYKFLSPSVRSLAVLDQIARKTWISPANGGYKDQATADQRYKLLERAIKIDREAAFKSISVGTFQIMGFNHAICGHQTAEGMFNAFCESETYQLSALAGFLTGKGLLTALRTRDFPEIERVYNGGGLKGVYAAKMRTASDALRAGKWRDYKPGSMTMKPTPQPEAPAIPEASGGWLDKLLEAISNIVKGWKK